MEALCKSLGQRVKCVPKVRFLQVYVTTLFNHTSIVFPYPRSGAEATGPGRNPRHPQAHSGGSLGVLRPYGIYSASSEFWIFPRVSSKGDMPGKTSEVRQPGGILIRFSNHLN
ncbi:hypothetical protein ATANTOWER_018225 [Ataeniobius toweri]|uniref:Uncharacterized protein n=1 Tax=Ataeniobius toweri TaxID=208326 RepID=A0ABU7AFW9_9TELE|nr:hypothetical protein [Ataeniobius toweri]